MEHVAGGYARIKNLAFAEVGAGSHMSAVKKKLPGVFLNARYSPVKLANATAEELKEEIIGLKQEGGSSISCVGIDNTVSDEQVQEFLFACSSI